MVIHSHRVVSYQADLALKKAIGSPVRWFMNQHHAARNTADGKDITTTERMRGSQARSPASGVSGTTVTGPSAAAHG